MIVKNSQNLKPWILEKPRWKPTADMDGIADVFQYYAGLADKDGSTDDWVT